MTGATNGATTSRRGLLVGLALGLPLIAYGVRGVFVDAADTHPADMARWLVGAALVDDLVIVPAALLVGTIARRFTPRRAWPAVRGGLLASGILALVAWPFVRGWGRDPTNPSLLARDYGAGLLLALVSIWVVVGAIVVGRVVAGRIAPRGGPPDG
jgi:hypothetical protein